MRAFRATGFWSNAANWSAGMPTGTNLNDVLNFGGSGSSGYTATLDYPPTTFQLATLSLNSSATVTETIAQTGGRHFEVKDLTGGPGLNVEQLGSGAFTVAVDFEVAGAGSRDFRVGGDGASTLTLSGVLNASNSAGFSLVKSGSST